MKPKATLVQRTTAALTEASLSRVWSHWSDSGFAIVSSDRGERTPRDNAKWNAKLRGAIRREGYGFIPLVGFWEEKDASTGKRRKVQELSFLVPAKREGETSLDNLLDAVKRWGMIDAALPQESVIFSPPGGPVQFLDPKTGREMFRLAKFVPGKVSDIYSRLRKGKGTFVFEGWRFTPPPSTFGEASRRKHEGEVAFIAME